MCTVTYIPSGDVAIITSNRDEHISREARLIAKAENVDGKKIVYPRDKTAGGTWFAANENGYVTVLLNGAANNHKRKPPYRKSRGLVVRNIITSKDPLDFLNEIDLDAIEPFTLILFDYNSLWEFRWDGIGKSMQKKDSAKAHIWSSWTLYNAAAQKQRNRYFDEFIVSNNQIDAGSILGFHRENHGDFENGFIIDRSNGLKTLSVTQVACKPREIVLDHYDLLANDKQSVSLQNSIAATLST